LPASQQSASNGTIDMPKELKITLRFYPGTDDELIAWLSELNLSYGKKGEAIKAAMRRGLEQTSGVTPDFLDAGSLLADIRQTIETTLQKSLGTFTGCVPINNSPLNEIKREKKLSIHSDHW
jgi:hypothetical protein